VFVLIGMRFEITGTVMFSGHSFRPVMMDSVMVGIGLLWS